MTGMVESTIENRCAWCGRVGEAITPDSVARIFKKMARTAGLSPDVVKDISGHSSRVGCAQDMAAFVDAQPSPHELHALITPP